MSPTGKKSEKLHIRLTEDIAREVRAVADLEHRPIQDQLRWLIVIGLQAVRAGVQGNAGEDRRTAPHDDAEMILPVPPIAARSRTVTQQNRRRA